MQDTILQMTKSSL
jgi:hypothetical protein